MNKIYIGDQEINTGGSGGGGSEFNPSDYVDTSTWNEHEKVIASALVNLKGLEDQIEAFDESIQAQENALLEEVHVVEQTKADASTVYTKNDIDMSDKVVAAALASLNERVMTLESSSGGSGESGDSFDPEYLELDLADVSARVYDAENDILDVSDRLDFVGDLTLDISARVKTIEDDYVVTNDISAFVAQSVFDASYNALDASALAFDASIKELASSSGGGTNPVFIEVTNSGDSTIKGVVNKNSAYDLSKIGNDSIILNGFNNVNHPAASGISSVASGRKSIASGNFSFAANEATASSEQSAAFNCATASGKNSFAIGRGLAKNVQSFAGGENSSTGNSYAVALGVYSFASGEDGAIAVGCYVNAKSYAESAFGKNNKEYNIHNYPFDGSTDVLLHSIGNGKNDSSRHNAFEVRQSGDIYVADVSAAGEYYEKPMINLQQKIYELEARISALENS